MSGIILGALGGAGEAMQNIGATRMKADLESDARAQESSLAVQRAKTLEEFKQTLQMKMGEQQRTAQRDRISAEAGSIADERVAGKRGEVEAGIADRSSWTPEQQAAVDQSLAIDRSGIVNDARTRAEAAVRTGDIGPKDAATIERDERRIDATEAATAQRERAAQMRDETQRYIAEMRDQTAQARIEALIRKSSGGSGGKDGTREALSFLDGARKELTSEAQNLNSMFKSEMKEARFPEEKAKIKAEYEPKLADIEKKRDLLEQDYNALRERVGLPSRQSANTAPAPSQAPASPAAKPDISKVQGAPAGSRFGGKTAKGWEVLDASGKLIGYAKD